MEQESIDYLDKVACIAHANMAHHQATPPEQRSYDEAGAALLMSAYLEMYEHWQNAKPGTEAPPKKVYVAAEACIQMRNWLQGLDRSDMTEQAEGLLEMVTAYMFLFRHMYVPRN